MTRTLEKKTSQNNKKNNEVKTGKDAVCHKTKAERDRHIVGIPLRPTQMKLATQNKLNVLYLVQTSRKKHCLHSYSRKLWG